MHVLPDAHYCCRVNTVAAYAQANRDVAMTQKPAGFAPFVLRGKNNFVDASAVVDVKTQVGPDCVVGAGTTIGAKCSIKKSVVGKK